MTAMPWGKFKGMPLSLVPLTYLCWLLDGATGADPQLLADVRLEIVRRMGADPSPQPMLALPEPAVADAASEIVSRGFRAVAQRAHPDHGGDDASMIAVNAARSFLQAAIERGAAA